MCGPWAMVLWQASERRLWFGRDPLGRRSLLWSGGPGRLQSSLLLCSVAGQHRTDLSELPCLGLFSVHVPPDCRSCADLRLQLHPWRHVTVADEWLPSVAPGPPLQSAAGMTVNPAVPDTALRAAIDAGGGLAEAARLPGMAAAVEQFEAVLLAAVRRRVENMPAVCAACLREDRPAPLCRCPRLAVLFSGGVDSMLVAAMADRCLPDHRAIDLLNVAFERPARPAAIAGKPRRSRPAAPATSVVPETAAESEFDVPDRVTGRTAGGSCRPSTRADSGTLSRYSPVVQRQSHTRHVFFF